MNTLTAAAVVVALGVLAVLQTGAHQPGLWGTLGLATIVAVLWRLRRPDRNGDRWDRRLAARVRPTSGVVYAAFAAIAIAVVIFLVHQNLVEDGHHALLDAFAAVVAAVVAVLIVGLTAEIMRSRRTTLQLCRRQRRLELIHAVSMTANSAASGRSALHAALQTVCSQLDWPMGVAYLGEDHQPEVVATSVRPALDRAWAEDLVSAAGQDPSSVHRTVRLAMSTRRPACSDDGPGGWDTDTAVPVRVAVPILADDDVVGALEFIVTDVARPFHLSDELRQTLATVGTQLGRTVERARHQQDALDRATALAAANRELEAAKHADQQRRVEAERANVAKSQFLASMSHELRTPLNGVLGFSQLLQESPLSDQQAEFVEYIARSGHHLLDLINGVLDISRIEAGQLNLSTDRVSVAEMVAEATTMLSPTADERNITLLTAVPDALHVQADPRRLCQVLLNLLSNAVKYNRNGGTVTIVGTPLSDDMVRVSVRDTGLGIAADLLPRLFAPFDRLDVTDVEGTGIGLALTRLLVEAMDGTIDVASDPGQGTNFWVDLPHAYPGADSVSPPQSLSGHTGQFSDDTTPTRDN